MSALLRSANEITGLPDDAFVVSAIPAPADRVASQSSNGQPMALNRTRDAFIDAAWQGSAEAGVRLSFATMSASRLREVAGPLGLTEQELEDAGVPGSSAGGPAGDGTVEFAIIIVELDSLGDASDPSPTWAGFGAGTGMGNSDLMFCGVDADGAVTLVDGTGIGFLPPRPDGGNVARLSSDGSVDGTRVVSRDTMLLAGGRGNADGVFGGGDSQNLIAGSGSTHCVVSRRLLPSESQNFPFVPVDVLSGLPAGATSVPIGSTSELPFLLAWSFESSTPVYHGTRRTRLAVPILTDLGEMPGDPSGSGDEQADKAVMAQVYGTDTEAGIVLPAWGRAGPGGAAVLPANEVEIVQDPDDLGILAGEAVAADGIGRESDEHRRQREALGLGPLLHVGF